VGVREQVLVKPKKIETERLESLCQRLCQWSLEASLAKVTESWQRGEKFDATALERLIYDQKERSHRLITLMRKCNEPALLSQEIMSGLDEFRDLHFLHWSDENQALLEAEDFERLQIRKGSLSTSEREEIQSHVTHTFRFLSQIPWTKELSNVPEIAYSHHERLNGKGYPRRLKAEDIPVQAKLMAISDVFDALVAHDRPYKPAVSVERSLEILEDEAKEGLLDGLLLRIFIEARVFEITTGPVHNNVNHKISSVRV